MSASGTTGDEVLVAQTDLAGGRPAPARGADAVRHLGGACDRDPVLVPLHRRIRRSLERPLAFLIVMVIALMLAVNLAMLARAFPSAGGYFTYLSRALHPRIGLFASWLYFLISPLVPAPILVYMGTVLETRVEGEVRLHVPVVAVRRSRTRDRHVRHLPRHQALGQGADPARRRRDRDRRGAEPLERLRSGPGRVQLRADQSRQHRRRRAPTASISPSSSASSRSQAGKAPARSPRRARTRAPPCRRR